MLIGAECLFLQFVHRIHLQESRSLTLHRYKSYTSHVERVSSNTGTVKVLNTSARILTLNVLRRVLAQGSTSGESFYRIYKRPHVNKGGWNRVPSRCPGDNRQKNSHRYISPEL